MRGYFAKNRRGEGKVNRKKNLRAGHFLTCGLQKRGKIGIFVKTKGNCPFWWCGLKISVSFLTSTVALAVYFFVQELL